MRPSGGPAGNRELRKALARAERAERRVRRMGLRQKQHRLERQQRGLVRQFASLMMKHIDAFFGGKI